MYGYIYITTNNLNGKSYIGKHKSSKFDKNYKGSGLVLNRAFSKYGFDNFTTEILCRCFSQEELDEEERFIISFFDCVASEEYYNVAPGGSGGGSMLGKHFSPESRSKISKSNKGKHSKEPRSLETRTRISRSLRGSNNPMYGKCGELHHNYGIDLSGDKNPMYGKKHSDESRAKMRKPHRPHKYRLICKSCGSNFLGNSPTQRYCLNCR